MAELMKGKVWHEHKHKVQYPVWVEPKRDEIRCHIKVDYDARSVEFLSYAGKPLANMQTFVPIWYNTAVATGWREFDTGFECNGNFNDSYRWVRSTKGVPKDLTGAPVRFYLFDLPEAASPFVERKDSRSRVLDGVYANRHLIHNIDGVFAHSEAQVEDMFIRARAAGREGIMVKTLNHTYQRGKRIDGWLKMKPEDDADGIITQINEAVSLEGERLGRAGSVQVVCEDNSVAQPSGIAHDLGRRMWEHPHEFIGQWCEFKFMERDRQGGYRHPVFHRIREAKE